MTERPRASVPPTMRPSVPAPVLRRIARVFERNVTARAPLTLQLLGRVLLHAAAVGAAVGVVSIAFVTGLDLVQQLVLERWVGYEPLRAAGETVFDGPGQHAYRPWLLVFVPALGALIGGLLSIFAPEIRGGGSDDIIDAFHRRDGLVRRRVPGLKVLASIFTLGFGGSGGREGPTMQIGGSIGSLVGRALRVTVRERRILLVAGTAAGMAAVFRTPLGAALLAVEVLHRNDFESDALVPSVLSSVVAYSVFISFSGGAGGALFAHAPSYPFVAAHLGLYAVMALGVSFAAAVFLRTMRTVKDVAARLPVPPWARPAVGGLALGGMAAASIHVFGDRLGEGHGLGILGGGYGAAQVAIVGADWLPGGVRGVEILLVFAAVKMLATSFTVGSGGSAGDFGPSMVIGGILGGAFGRAAQLVFADPRIDPGAFALVGMGTFYGGIAHVPIASLVMTCELAGSYDLLVPLMFAEGIAYVMLRNRSLYHAQVATKRESPAHRDDLILDVLKDIRVATVLVRRTDLVVFAPGTEGREVLRRVAESTWQDAFPVVGDEGALVGVIASDVLRAAALRPDLGASVEARDLMTAPVSVTPDDDLHTALERLLEHGARELLVVSAADGSILGVLDEAEITAAYLAATGGPSAR